MTHREECPKCGENRSLMLMIISPPIKLGMSIDYADRYSEIECVSCKHTFKLK